MQLLLVGCVVSGKLVNLLKIIIPVEHSWYEKSDIVQKKRSVMDMDGRYKINLSSFFILKNTHEGLLLKDTWGTRCSHSLPSC